MGLAAIPTVTATVTDLGTVATATGNAVATAVANATVVGGSTALAVGSGLLP